MTTAYTFPYAGHTVDLDACHIEFSPFWSSERAERLGHKPDALLARGLQAAASPVNGSGATILRNETEGDRGEALTAAKQAQPDLIPQESLFVCGQMGANVTKVYAEQAQPERAPITDEYLESLRDKDFRFFHGIKQGGQQ